MRWNTTLSEALFRFSRLFILFLTLSSVSLADYAWIPKYQNLWAKLGMDYLASRENFGSDGDRNDITYQNRIVDFTEYKFWIEGEYGIAENVSASLRPTFLWNSINPLTGVGTGFPSNGGMADMFVGFKWNPVKTPFLLTPELQVKFPMYGTSTLLADELAMGDGDVSIATIANLGYRATNYLVFGFSPGFKYRSGNYKSQILLDGMIGFIYNPVFFRFFWNWAIAMGKDETTTLVLNNPEFGSGSSFARLSYNSEMLSAGAKFGVKFHENYRIELNFEQALTGNRAPYFWKLGFNFYAPFDFYKEEKRIKVKEIPFDSDQPPENG